MNFRLGYVYFLTFGILAVVGILLFRALTLTADSKSILEMLLGALTTILMSAIHSQFQGTETNPVPQKPLEPAPSPLGALTP